MTFIEEYYDRIFVINRDARVDRRIEYEAEFARFGITKYERFRAYDEANIDGWVGGNGGATTSHRALLDVIAYHQWPRVLILEDDFKIVREDFHALFEQMIKEVPDDASMLYLGGHYAEAPQARVSKHVIRIGAMMTTSSYAVTWKSARTIAPNIYGSAPIDTLYFKWNRELPCYIFQPRLMVQRTSFSDLQGREMSNMECMLDPRHENMV